MGFFDTFKLSKLKEGLQKSAGQLTDGLKKALTHKKLDDAMCEALEEALLRADLGVPLTTRLIADLRQQKFADDITLANIQQHLATAITQQLTPVAKPLALPATAKPAVILMVGVNGAGKTTTIGKLAKQFKDAGQQVMVAAGDTYRAAAVEQLDVWARRTGVPIVKPEKEGADAAALLFRAYTEAQAAGADILLCDTAGRLQNRQDLMAQLEKILRVLKKQDPDAPHATLLVLDATVGQNAHQQVEAFRDMAGVTGLVVTKLDGTAKGGVVVALAERFGLPVHFIGVGEQVDDLKPFAAADFAQALVQGA